MSKTIGKFVLFTFIAAFLTLFLIQVASAYTWICLSQGESYGLYTCSTGHSNGYCLVCYNNGVSSGTGNSAQNNCGDVSPPSCTYSATTCFPASKRTCTVNNVTGSQTCLSTSTWGACSAGAGGNSTVDLTDVYNRLAALEQWKTSANANITSINSRLTLLEQWKLTIQATVDTLKSWLGYSATNTFCQVSQSCGGSSCTESWQCGVWTTCNAGFQTRSCTDTNACGTTAFKPAVSQSCSGSCTENWQCGAWGACQPSNTSVRTCTDSNACGTAISIPAESQSCVYVADPRIVTFRTNAATKNDYGNAASQLALDFNGDGQLECFMYSTFYSSYYERLPTTLVKTPEGYNVNKYGSNKVIIDYSQKYIYVPANGGCTIPTTTVPTAGYREIYK